MKSKKTRGLMAAILITGMTLGTTLGCSDPAGDMNGEEPDDGFAEARPQLEQQLRQEKENEVIMAHLDELRQEADVEKDMDAVEGDDPDATVAVVNGEEIKKQSFEEFENHERQNLAMMGMDPDSQEADEIIEDLRPEILENLIANTALVQKVEAEGISADEEMVEQEYQQYVQQAGSEEELEQQLEGSGFTLEELEEAIIEQQAINTYVADYVDENLSEDDLDFSEEELRELYDELMEQQQGQQPQMPQQPME